MVQSKQKEITMRKLKHLNETVLIIISLVCLILSVIFGVLTFFNEFEPISLLFGILTICFIYIGALLFHKSMMKFLDTNEKN